MFSASCLIDLQVTDFRSDGVQRWRKEAASTIHTGFLGKNKQILTTLLEDIFSLLVSMVTVKLLFFFCVAQYIKYNYLFWYHSILRPLKMCIQLLRGHFLFSWKLPMTPLHLPFSLGEVLVFALKDILIYRKESLKPSRLLEDVWDACARYLSRQIRVMLLEPFQAAFGWERRGTPRTSL